MGQLIACIVIIALATIFLPLAVGSIRRSRQKTGAGGLGSALVDLDRVLNPATEHSIQARQEQTEEQPSRDAPPV